MVLDEGKYPHIYALAYMLRRNDQSLDTHGWDEGVLEMVDKDLGATPLSELVAYTNQEEWDPEDMKFAVAHSFMVDNGVVEE